MLWGERWTADTIQPSFVPSLKSYWPKSLGHSSKSHWNESTIRNRTLPQCPNHTITASQPDLQVVLPMHIKPVLDCLPHCFLRSSTRLFLWLVGRVVLVPLVPKSGSIWLGVPLSWERSSCLVHQGNTCKTYTENETETKQMSSWRCCPSFTSVMVDCPRITVRFPHLTTSHTCKR